MIKKILIANRGEIAVRIIKTCKKMGIKTVAIYSDADIEATHVKAADEAFWVGESAVMKSYLNIEKILKISKENNIDAIHPGYGLLSENRIFAGKVREAGIVFIGPSSESMEKMSLKVESRQLAQDIGVPIIPGTGVIDSPDLLKAKATEIGFPVILKASAGGGGIGMEVVQNSENIEKALN
jgi:acetyl-CoA carboxylase, biotin carboxylase subunit